MPRVLILCTGNSCRSQLAEALWRSIGTQGGWECHSAGTHPAGEVHPLALKALTEIGVPVGGLRSKPLTELQDQKFDIVVTVCDRAKESCPVFPGCRELLHWSFADPALADPALADPALAEGTPEEKLAVFQRVREEIRVAIRDYLRTPAVRFWQWMTQSVSQSPQQLPAAEAQRYDTVVARISTALRERQRVFSEIPMIISEHFRDRGWAWNGFYTLYRDAHNKDVLRLTSSAGPPVCAEIPRKGGVGASGMCFDCLAMNQTIVASDVSRWPGYVFCDAESGLKTVAGMACPIRGYDSLPLGVWDLDSTKPLTEYDAFFFDRLFATLSTVLKPTRALLEGRDDQGQTRPRGRPNFRRQADHPDRGQTRVRHDVRHPRDVRQPFSPASATSTGSGHSEANKEAIKLDQFLKWRGLVDTGGGAKVVVQAGEVRVNGEIEKRRGRRLQPGDVVEYQGKSHTVELQAKE